MTVYILEHELSELSQYHGTTYTFKGAKETLTWPCSGGAFLGPAGALNFCNRLNLSHKLFTLEDRPHFESGDVVIVHSVGAQNAKLVQFIKQLQNSPVIIIALGHIKAYESILHLSEAKQIRIDNPSIGLGYRLQAKDEPILASSFHWLLSLAETTDNVTQTRGEIIQFNGDFNAPSLATVNIVNKGSMIYSRNNFHFVNLNLFASLQAWLQGQEDILPWLNWKPRQHWLDHFCEEIYELLASINCFKVSPIEATSRVNHVVLRHDVDSSKDLAYLEATQKLKLPASYSLLLDNNRQFWLDRLKDIPNLELSFHYSTLGNFYIDVLMRKLKLPGTIRLRHYKSHVCGKGLAKQIKKAKKKKIPAHLTTRHYNNYYYPEHIDAYFYAEEQHPDFIGSNSFMGSKVIRWGDIYYEKGLNSIARAPDVHFPFWHPYKLANAAKAGQLSRTYESMAVLEPEVEFVRSLFSHKLKYIKDFTYVLNYHPAHAHTNVFNKGPADLEELVDIFQENKVRVATIEDIYNAI
jgi:hypothetical protein